MIDFPAFGQFKWYRRLCGGKWNLWNHFLPMPLIWMRDGKRPGCASHIIKEESYFP